MIPSLAALGALVDQILIGTRNFAKVAAAIGTTTTKVKTTNAAQFCIDGRMYTKAATDDFWTLAGTVIPASCTGYFLLCMDTAGAAVVLQGAILDANGNYVSSSPVKGGNKIHADLPLSSGAPTCCPIAELKVVMGAGGAFTPGTTALTGGSVSSATYTDLSVVPTTGKGA